MSVLIIFIKLIAVFVVGLTLNEFEIGKGSAAHHSQHQQQDNRV